MLFRLREAVELYGYGEYTAGLLNGLSLVGINAEDVELRVVAVRKLLRHAGLSAVVCDDVVGDSEKGARVLGKVRYYNSELGRGVIDVAGGEKVLVDWRSVNQMNGAVLSGAVLVEDELVMLRVKRGEHGPEAIDLSRVSAK